MAGSTVRVQWLADNAQFRKAVREIESDSQNVEGKFIRLADMAKGFLAVKAAGAIKDFVADSKRAYSDLEQTTGAVEQVFGDSSKTIIDWAKGTAKGIGLAASESQQASAVLGQFFQNFGWSAEEAADRVKILIERTADMASFGNTDVPQALAAMQSALRGQFLPIQQYGVTINAAMVEQRALEEGLAATAKELTDQDKMWARQQLILEQTSKIAGQFSRELDTIAGKEAVMRAETEELKAALGESLAPAFHAALDAAKPVVTIIGSLINLFSVATGSSDKLTGAIRQFTIMTGHQADTAAAALTIMKDFGQSATDLIPALDLSRAELVTLAGASDELLKSFGFNEDQIKELRTAVVAELSPSLDTAAQRFVDAARAAEEMAAAQEGTTLSAEELEEAQRKANEEVEKAAKAAEAAARAERERYDAIPNLSRALEKQAEAERNVVEVLKKNKEGSEAHIDALWKLAEANQAVQDAEERLVASGQLTREEWIRQQEAMGLTRQQAETLADSLDRAFQNRTSTHTTVFKEVGGSGGTNARLPKFHAGGTYRAPTPGGEGLAILRDGETVHPPGGASSTPTPAPLQSTPPPAPTLNEYSIVVQTGIGDPEAISRAVVEALQRYEQRNGSVPIRTRN